MKLPPRDYESAVHMLADAAATAPDRVALVCGDARLTFAEYGRCAAGMARFLGECGAGPGARVVLACGNALETPVAIYGVLSAHAEVVLVNPAYTAREMRTMLAEVAPTVIVADAAAEDVVRPLAAELGVSSCLVMGRGGLALDAWRDDRKPTLPRPFPQGGDPAVILFSGGSTGRPKAAAHSHREVVWNVRQVEAAWTMRDDMECSLAVAPMFHIFGLGRAVFMPVYRRGRVVIMPKYHPQPVLDAIDRHGITVIPGAPTLFIGLLNHPGFATTDFSHIRFAIAAGAALPDAAARTWVAATGCELLSGYGLTEAAPVALRRPGDPPGSVGSIAAETDVEIIDLESGDAVREAGARGEIRVRGPQVAKGYCDRPEETAAAFRDGWFYTGDIGYFDEDRILFVTGRSKDVINVSGYDVFPREIEAVLASLDEIMEVAAVGVADDYRGESVRACVAPKPGAMLDKQVIVDHCRRNLVKYKVPTEIIILKALPKTSVGKIDRRALAAL